MNKTEKIFVAGHRGLAGSAIVRALEKNGYKNLITKTRAELDLLDKNQVREFFERERPDNVIIAAAKVGGIGANSKFPVDFIYENLMIETNLISAAHEYKVKKLIFLGSGCTYPKFTDQPIKEEALLTGLPEPTNQPFAVAKIAGIVLCQSYQKQYGDNFISLMPTNLYGPNDNFDPEKSHVIAALIKRFHEAKESGLAEVTLWGTGAARREFLHSDDLGEACVFLLENYNDGEIINIGSGQDVSIKELAEKVSQVVGYQGKIAWDTTKPDGMPKRLLDSSKIEALGWRASISLDQGLRNAYEWYCKNVK